MSCFTGKGTHRILVIAANENFRRTISRILCRCGYTTDLACSGEEAMRALEREPYDLVLSEVLLPGVVCGLTVLCTAPASTDARFPSSSSPSARRSASAGSSAASKASTA